MQRVGQPASIRCITDAVTFPVFGVSLKASEVGGGRAGAAGVLGGGDSPLRTGALTSAGIFQSCHLRPVPLIPAVTGYHLCSPSAGLANCSTWSPNASQGAEDFHCKHGHTAEKSPLGGLCVVIYSKNKKKEEKTDAAVAVVHTAAH